MQKRTQGVADRIEDLFGPSNRALLRPGDTIGLWTFSDDVSTGNLPLQHWSPDIAKTVAGRFGQFLNGQKYDKSANLEKVLPMLTKVIQGSEFITVVIVSSGEGRLTGTPFDEQINTAYKGWRAKQQKSSMPLVTVLRAKKGTVTDYAVSPAPWPVDMPPLPPELLKMDIAQLKPSTSSKTSSTAPQPLIISGKKPAPVEPPREGSETPGPKAKAIAEPIPSERTSTTTVSRVDDSSLPGLSPNSSLPLTNSSSSSGELPWTPIETPQSGRIETVAVGEKVKNQNTVLNRAAPTAETKNAEAQNGKGTASISRDLAAGARSVTNLVEETLAQPNLSNAAEPPIAPLATPVPFTQRNSVRIAVATAFLFASIGLYIRYRRSRRVIKPSLITRSLERGDR
jgi:hypothetical protein